jgi:hypothetical protein
VGNGGKKTGGKKTRGKKWREENWREEMAGRKMAGRKVAGRKMAGRKMAGRNGGKTKARIFYQPVLKGIFFVIKKCISLEPSVNGRNMTLISMLRYMCSTFMFSRYPEAPKTPSVKTLDRVSGAIYPLDVHRMGVAKWI